MFIAGLSSYSQSPQANIDQGNNGSLSNLHNPVDWVNGNLNEQQNHYIEGQSIPYRAVLDRIKIGCETKILIAFDARRNGKMAIDYLTSNDWYGAHENVFGTGHNEAVNPLLGLSGTYSLPSFFNLPAPGAINTPVPGQPTASYNTVALAGKNKMAIYNGTISNITWVTPPNYSEANATYEAVIEVTFTPTALPVVMSWGGHIASRIDWGFVNGEPRSAGGISGSPYHIRLVEWTKYTPQNSGTCSSQTASIGNQDRSLQISAPPCQNINATITLNLSHFNVDNQIDLNVTASGGFVPYTYLWSTSTPNVTLNSTTIQNPVATVTGAASEVSFTVIVTDAIGCQVTKTITQTLAPRPCGIDGPSEVCPNSNVQFTFPFNGATSVSWSVSGHGSIDGSNQGTPVNVVASNVCGGEYIVTVTAVFPNETVTCSKTVTVLTPPAATFTSPPGDITVACGQVPPLSPLSYSNGGQGGCAIGGQVTGQQSGSYTACGGSIVQSWSFTDLCGRTISHSRTITVLPAPLPTFTNAPGNTTLTSCSASLPVASSLSYTNSQSGDCLLAGQSAPSVIVMTSGNAPCERVYTETWTVTVCGTPITHSRTITIPAAPQASFIAAPGSINVACNQVPAPIVLSYSNGLLSPCTIEGSAQPQRTGTPSICGYTLTDTWTFTDPCGRGTTTHSRTITVAPAPLPTFINPPGALTVSCSEVPALVSLDYTNSGTGACEISGTIQGVRTGSYDKCGGTLTDTWTIPAPCPGGQPIVHSRAITVTAAPRPTYTNPPGSTSIDCGAAPPTGTVLNYSNDLTGTCGISGQVTGVISGGPHTACGGTYTETWTVVICGTPLTYSRTITVNPAPKAEFAQAPNLTIPCGSAPPTGTSLSYTNGATTTCLISGTATGVITGNHTACGGTYIETWTFTDGCNRTSTRSRTITVEAAPKAEFAQAPNLTIPCGSAPPTGTSLAYSNGLEGSCGINGSATGVITGNHTACGGTYVETWTFVDACQRTSTRTRTITVEAAPKAEWVAPLPGNIVSELCGTRPLTSSLSYSNGQTGTCGISGSVLSEITGGSPDNCGTYTETWTYTDECGRTISHFRTIDVPCCKGCTYTQGFYGNVGGNGCLPDGTTGTANSIMTNALSSEPGEMKVFGRQDMNRYWIIRKTDVNQGAASNIFKMLPGGGNSQAFGPDNVSGVPEYTNNASWHLAPLQNGGPNKGKIRNSLMAQTIVMYFNLKMDAALGGYHLPYDTLITSDVVCGTNNVVPNTSRKFGLPHSVVVFLNGGNGYANTITDLYRLANDYLGGLTPGNLGPDSVSRAVDILNNAFDECRAITGYIPYVASGRFTESKITTTTESVIGAKLSVTAFPNPYENGTFNLTINAPESGQATIELYSLDGRKIMQTQKAVFSKRNETVNIEVPARWLHTRLVYRVTTGKYETKGVVLSPN